MQSVRDSQDQEDAKFLERLEHLAGRKREMERRYKRISKLHPNRLNSFLQAERDQAAVKIQNWWRKRRPVTIDLRKEVGFFFHDFEAYPRRTIRSTD